MRVEIVALDAMASSVTSWIGGGRNLVGGGRDHVVWRSVRGQKSPCYGRYMKDGFRVCALSDDELLSRTSELVARGRRIDAVLIAHLAEVEARKLHLREAFP